MEANYHSTNDQRNQIKPWYQWQIANKGNDSINTFGNSGYTAIQRGNEMSEGVH